LEGATFFAMEVDIHLGFHIKRKIERKRQFDEDANDAYVDSQSSDESFGVNYFIPFVDQTIVSLTWSFGQYQGYENTFGFLFTSDRLRSLDG
jgi:hypothetical protein